MKKSSETIASNTKVPLWIDHGEEFNKNPMLREKVTSKYSKMEGSRTKMCSGNSLISSGLTKQKWGSLKK